VVRRLRYNSAVPARAKRDPSRVRLQPADAFDLIRWLARSQSDPRKAVAELVQNAIDANARAIVVERRRRGKRAALIVRDDGDGIRPDEDRRRRPARGALSEPASGRLKHGRRSDRGVVRPRRRRARAPLWPSSSAGSPGRTVCDPARAAFCKFRGFGRMAWGDLPEIVDFPGTSCASIDSVGPFA
jgi:anti-sigma regulatory factor (Ser/Thr protein kinase)